MSWLTEIWPFVPGQQALILKIGGLGASALYALNVLLKLSVALRQPVALETLVQAFVVDVNARVRAERYATYALIIWVLLAFFALAMDVQINGMQIVDLKRQ